jgi:hypothetical protein
LAMATKSREPKEMVLLGTKVSSPVKVKAIGVKMPLDVLEAPLPCAPTIVVSETGATHTVEFIGSAGG